ncbi:transposase [Gymnodinialimonas phycosphaerae]|uniref:transposase n=1 Tax=Gymnodinialimonas phycosphaerae TaxID=2841589 RepID=UPI003D01134D
MGILKEHQAGVAAKELCRKHGISDATFYKWRSKCGGADASAQWAQGSRWQSRRGRTRGGRSTSCRTRSKTGVGSGC